MKAIEIHNASGAVVATVGINEGARAVYTLGSEDYVVLPFALQEPVGIDAGCWVDLSEVLGPEMGGKAAKRYEVTEPVSARYDESTGGYSYELKLHAYYMAWGKKLFKYMPGTGGAEVAWNLTADLGTHMQVFLRNLSAYGFTYNGEAYVVAVDSTVDASAAHLLQYSTTYLIDALNMIAQSWQCEWWVTDKTIHFGRLEHSDAMPLHIGVEAERMERTDSKGKYATRLYVYGASHNLPPTYPDDSRKVTADVTKNGVVQRRLMLPEGVPYLDAYRYKSDGTRVYIGAKGYNDGTTRPMPTAEAMEGVLVKDDIYPRTESAISAVGSYEKTATADDGSGDTVTQRFYYVSTDGIGFDETYMLEASTLQIRLTSGKMNGMLFDCIFRKAGTEVGGVTLEADVFELVASDESTYGRVLPDALLHPETGDKMVLLGWDSSKMEDMGLVGVAEDALLEAGKAYIQRTMKQDGTVSVTLMSHWAAEDATARTFTPGQRVELYNDALWADGKRGSRVIGYDIKLDLPYDHPRYTIGECVEYSRITAIEDKVQEIVVNGASFIGGGTGGGTSVYLIKTNDGTAPSDYNAYSAARSDRNYLSKTHDDATPHSLAIGGTVKAGTAEAGVIKTTGAKKGGMDGTGVIADGGALEVDTLTVRRKAVFNELEIKRTSYAGGDTIYSFAGNKIVEVIETTNTEFDIPVWRCMWLKQDADGNQVDNYWRVGDQALCKSANLGTGENVSNKYYWRLVVHAGICLYNKKFYNCVDFYDGRDENGEETTNYVQLGKIALLARHAYDYDSKNNEIPVHNDIPKAGDTIVQLGNQIEPENRGSAYAVYVGEGRRVDYVGIGSSDTLGPYNLEGRKASNLTPAGWEITNNFFKWTYKDNFGNIQTRPATMFMGEYDAYVRYVKDMSVIYNGTQWLCIKDLPNFGSNPTPNIYTPGTVLGNVFWQKMSGGEKGDKGDPGAPGAIGQGVFTSYVFARCPVQPHQLASTVGSYTNPVPTAEYGVRDANGESYYYQWSDGMPASTSGNYPVWMCSRKFTSDGLAPQDAEWSTPVMLADTADFDVQYYNHDEWRRPNEPYNGAPLPYVHHEAYNNGWVDTPSESAVWMATDKFTNGAWQGWKIVKIKGENGQDGKPGKPAPSVIGVISYFARLSVKEGIYSASDVYGSPYIDKSSGVRGAYSSLVEPTEQYNYTWSWDSIEYSDFTHQTTTPRVIKDWNERGTQGPAGDKGDKGDPGAPGEPGGKGDDGQDAYSIIISPSIISLGTADNGSVKIEDATRYANVMLMRGGQSVQIKAKGTPTSAHGTAAFKTGTNPTQVVTMQVVSIGNQEEIDYDGDGTNDTYIPYGGGTFSFTVQEVTTGNTFNVEIPFTVSGTALAAKFYHDNKEFVSRFASWQLDGGQYVQMSESYIEQKAEQVALGVTEKMSYTGANLLPSSDFKQYDTRQEIVCVTSDDINQSDSPQYVKVYPVLGSTYNGQQVWRIYCKGVSENTFGCLRFILSNTVVGRKYKARTYVRRIGYIGDGGTKDYIQLVDITSNDRKGYNNWGNSDGCYERDLSSSWRMFEVYSRDAYSSAYTYNEFAIILNRRGYIEFTTPIVDGYAGNIEVYPVEISSTDARVTKTLIAHAPDESHNGQNYLRMYAKNNTSDIFAMMKYDVSGLMKKSNNAEYNVGGGVKNYGDTTYVFSVWVKRGHSKYDGSHTIYIDAVDESADKWIAGYEKNCNEIEDGAWHRISIKLPGFSGSGRVTMCVKNNGDMLFSEPQLEEGVVPTPWMPRVAVADELRRTGIDITSGRIDMQADHFTLRNAAGEQTMGVDASGNAEFTGKLNASGFVVRNTANGLPGMRMDFDDQGRPHLIFYNENGLEAYDLGYAGGLSKIIDMVSKGSFSEKSPYYYVSDVNRLGGNLFNTVVNATGKYYQYAAPRINLQNGTGQIKDGYEIYDNKCYKTATYWVEDTGFLGSTANYAASGFYVQGAMWMESIMYGDYAPKPVIQIKDGKIVGVVGYLYADRNKITSYRSASSLAALQALSADEPSMLSLGDEDYADDGANADNGASTINYHGANVANVANGDDAYHEANVANGANGDVTGDAEAGDGVTDASDSVVDAGDAVTDDASTPTEPQEPSVE